MFKSHFKKNDANPISGIGFPLLMSIAVFLYVHYTFDKNDPATKGVEAVHVYTPEERFNTFLAQKEKVNNEYIVLENEVVQVGIDRATGGVTHHLLKGIVDHEGKEVHLLSPGRSQIIFRAVIEGGSISLKGVKSELIDQEKDSVSIRYTFEEDRSLVIVYRLQRYRVDCDIKEIKGGINGLEIDWHQSIDQLEPSQDLANSYSEVSYYNQTKGVQTLQKIKNNNPQVKEQVDMVWFAFKNRYFNSGLSSTTPMQCKLIGVRKGDRDSAQVKEAGTITHLSFKNRKESDLHFYFGPNNYSDLLGFAPCYEYNHYLGWRVFHYINLYIVLPLYQQLEKSGWHPLLLLLLLLLLLKLLNMPNSYRTAIQTIKEKALEPDLNILKINYADDSELYKQKKDALFRGKGLNVWKQKIINGIIQLLVLVSFYGFLPYYIGFRQVPFLFIKDLSSHYTLLQLKWHLPFIGDKLHLSAILALFASLSSKIFEKKNVQKEPGTPESMKYISYVMLIPFMIIGNGRPIIIIYLLFINTLLDNLIQMILLRAINHEKVKEDFLAQAQLIKSNEGEQGGSRYFKRLQKKINKKKV